MWSWSNSPSLNPNFQAVSQFPGSAFQADPSTLLSFPPPSSIHPPPSYPDFTTPPLPFTHPPTGNSGTGGGSGWHPISVEHISSSLQHPSTHHHQTGGGIASVTGLQDTARFHTPPTNSPFSVDFLLQKSGPPHEVGYSDHHHHTYATTSNDHHHHHQQQVTGFSAIDYHTSPNSQQNTPQFESNTTNFGGGDNNTVSHQPYRTDHYTDHPSTFPIDFTNTSDHTSTHCNDAISEAPYSPPGLILKDDTVSNDKSSFTPPPEEEEGKAINDSTASTGGAGGFNDSTASTGGTFVTGGFQLGVSPPPVHERPKSLVNAKYESSNSDDVEETIEKVSKDTPILPPLVSMETQDKTSCYDDDDDVFLPIPSESVSPKEATPLKPHLPLPTSSKPKEEQTSPMMVIGRRGRAAGKVLDESKLRLPLDKGWQRVVRARITENTTSPRVDICYITPCNRRLRTFPEIQRYLATNSITDLTIDHFTFSKKVNVGLVVDERSDNSDNPLIHPKRGRPPKRPATYNVSKQEERSGGETDKLRISLEPHEIKSVTVIPSSVPVSTVTVPPVTYHEEPHTITKVVNTATNIPVSSNTATTTGSTIPSIINTVSSFTSTMSINSSAPLINSITAASTGISNSTTDSTTGSITNTANSNTVTNGGSILSVGEATTLPQATPPLLSTANHHPVVATNKTKDQTIVKRPRGRPKGSSTKSKTQEGSVIQLASSGRKGRKPKHITHIPPTIASAPTQITNLSLDTTTPNATSSNAAQILLPKLTSNSLSIEEAKSERTMKDKDKKRQLLQANKVKKKAETNQRQRRTSQQTRRQREKALLKQAKERQERLNKQKEADWYQLRKSRIAKQREESNQLKARERTLRLLQEIQQRELENDRIMRLRQLEREKAEQLRRPTEDLLVNDLITLPPLTKLKWMKLPSPIFADLVMVFEFSRSFDDYLEMEGFPKFPEVYAGLFNKRIKREEDDEEERPNGLMCLTLQLVKAVVHDGGARTQTISGLPLRDIDIKEDTLSEVLRLYLQNKRNHTLHNITGLLVEYPYQCLCPIDKTTVLAYLVDELLNSVSLCREIDNRMEQITSLRRDKWKISLKLKRFRSRLTDSFGVHSTVKPVMYSGRGRPPKRALLNAGIPNEDADSSDEEGGGGGEMEEDPAVEDTYYSEEDTDEDIPGEKDDLQKRIKELKRKLFLVRGRISTVTRMMRKFPLGQDRYTRQYWNLPEMGGVLIEGQETSHNEYLDTLFIDNENKGQDNNNNLRDSLSPSIVEDESRATSDVPFSSQSSPQVNGPLQGVWPTDSPAKYSDDTDSIDVIGTPNKHALSNVSTPTKQIVNNMPSSLAMSTTFSNLTTPTTSTNLTTPTKSSKLTTPSKNSNLTIPSKTPTSSDLTTPTTSSNLPSLSKEDSTDKSHPLEISTRHTIEKEVWFSLLPRKPCELLHFIGASSNQLVINGGGQQQYIVPGGGAGNYTAFMTQDGTTVIGQPLVQQVQLGYAVVGNTLVPQTQYIIQQNPLTGTTTTTTTDEQQQQQYISLPNGQLAAIPSGASSSNIQYANIGGNQYAIVQSLDGGVSAVEGSNEVTSATNTALREELPRKKIKKNEETVDHQEQQQQFVTLALPTGAGGETQYCQVPADPRVLSGEYSYAIMPQGDGTSQIVLVENNSLHTMGTTGSGNEEIVEMECPPSTVFDNDYEGQPWMVDITLMYSDSPLPFNNNNEPTVEEKKKEDEKPLKELLQEISSDLTQGWWTISSPMEIDYLLRCLTMRGYREKGLHKLLQKNKDSICATLKSTLLTTPPFETKMESQKDITQANEGVESQNNEEVESQNNKGKESQDNEEVESQYSQVMESQDSQAMESQDSEGMESQNNEEVESQSNEEVESQSNEEVESQSNEEVESQSNEEVESQEMESQDEAESQNMMESQEIDFMGDHKMEGDSSDVNGDASTFFSLEANKMACSVMNYLEAMESRLFDAHLQIKGISKDAYQSVFLKGMTPPSLVMIGSRLLQFESCVQKRYLKPPFKEKHTSNADAKNEQSIDTTTDTTPPPDPVALTKWKTAIVQATSSSQLAVCINQLERCIAWEKSPMKVFCVVCQTGDNESLLLLCDRCDRGTHTYCCRPKLDTIPEGDWFCHNCTINASRKIVCGVCQSSRGSLLHCTQCPNVFHKRCLNPPLTKMPTLPWVCIECRRECRRKPGRPRSSKDDLIFCQALLMELEEQDVAWPFLEPVNRKKFPDYYRVIKRPMDFQTIKQKLSQGKYSNKDSFASDVKLIFDNCSYYNEDDSQIGMAGHAMRQYFEVKWTEMIQH